MRSLAVESLSVRGFRNLASVDLALGPGFNVLSGENGQGKTNLLEAVYVVATSRSFRTSRLADLVGVGGSTASVRAIVREDDERREQSVGVRVGMRAVRVDGKRPPTLAAFAVKTPVVVFHPGAVALSAGSGADRRRLLDRLALYLGPASIADAEAYGKAARARQRVLEVRGPEGADLGGWEELMVRHGLALSEAREAAAERLARATSEAFARIGAPGSGLVAFYQRSSPRDAGRFREALARSRVRDRARGSASVGPHRDDLALELGGRPVRGFASQGQHRAIVLSLELAEMHVVGEARGVWPILLLDDVSSELDDERTSALLRTLGETRGQVILTTTRAALIRTPRPASPASVASVARQAGAGGAKTAGDSVTTQERRDFSVVGGAIEPLL